MTKTFTFTTSIEVEFDENDRTENVVEQAAMWFLEDVLHSNRNNEFLNNDFMTLKNWSIKPSHKPTKPQQQYTDCKCSQEVNECMDAVNGDIN